MEKLTKANKLGLVFLLLALGIVGGMECGDISFVAGCASGIICAVAGLICWI